MGLSRVRVAIAQLNLIVGDISGNVAQIADAAMAAELNGAQALLTPELSICGYPPEDLLLRPSFHQQCKLALNELCNKTEKLNLYTVVGLPVYQDNICFNAAAVVYKGKVIGVYHKHDLPNYDVFDEQRYFTPDNRPLVFGIHDIRFGINICEDTWYPYAPSASAAAGAEVLLILNASPFHMGKQSQRQKVISQRVHETGLSMIYANLLGGQDELVFDGASFAMNSQQQVVCQMPWFEAKLGYIDVVRNTDGNIQLQNGSCHTIRDETALVYQALVFGVRDYVCKNGFPGVLIGLSGGVDSALTLAIAVDALGADKVHAVMMPSPYTAEISWLDSREMAKTLGVQYSEIPIHSCMNTFDESLSGFFGQFSADTTQENLQARIRGTLLMALSNKTGRLVLTTGNKSEMSTGYCTLYGDMAGGFAVIKDIFKTLVYRLCEYRNTQEQVIPQRILKRPPSAELRPDQTDQDSLPPYEVLDGILSSYIENNASIDMMIEMGFSRQDIAKTLRLLQLSEYKRRQAPIGIRVTHRAFGRDWRYPITSRFKESGI